MPRWSNEPPAADNDYALRIVRTPPDKPLVGIVTSAEIVGTPTHYVHNRTLPCEATQECPFCQEGHSTRWHGYLACLLVQSLEHALFEFTKTMAQPFITYQAIYQTLRGCTFQANRPSKRPNGRVLIKCKHVDGADLRLPEPPDVKRILCHIWNVQHNPRGDWRDPSDGTRRLNTDAGNGDGRYRPEIHTEKS